MTTSDRDSDEKPATGVLVEHFFRHESGRLIAGLVARFGMTHLERIEDAVQHALAKALATWVRSGTPDNPSAWLTRVAQNQLIDQLRREAMASQPRVFAELDRQVEAREQSLVSTPADPHVAFTDEVADAELRMLFVCCDEQLPARTQLVLSLRLLCGFSTREIATRLFLSDANVQKLLSRGRARLREIWRDRPAQRWSSVASEEVEKRLSVVLHVIYLLFNEGYSSQVEDAAIRRDLCTEALRLAQLVVSHACGDTPESWALLALLRLHTARIDSRTDERGELLLLEEQDRSRWDRNQIALGMQALLRAGQGDRFTRYHAEAAVLAEHCMAPSFAATRWHEIADLYAMLERMQPSPLHTLNRAIAVAQCQGPRAGLAILEDMKPPAWLTTYYLWDATHGELLRRCGEFSRAAKYLERAMDSAPTASERRIFQKRLRRCEEQDCGEQPMSPQEEERSTAPARAD